MRSRKGRALDRKGFPPYPPPMASEAVDGRRAAEARKTGTGVRPRDFRALTSACLELHFVDRVRVIALVSLRRKQLCKISHEGRVTGSWRSASLLA